jgi:hypothetical protein
MARAAKKTTTGGRRRNYAPKPDQIGTRKYLPIGWANWLGFVLFGLITLAMAAEFVTSLAESRGADPVAAGLMTVGLAYMVYLFGTVRLRD